MPTSCVTAALRVGLSVAAIAGLGYFVGTERASAEPHDHHPSSKPPAASFCPDGWTLARTHLRGQWIGSGIDPVTHLTRPELVQSSDPQTADRYVVGLVCVQDLSPAERLAEYNGVSSGSQVLPFVLP